MLDILADDVLARPVTIRAVHQQRRDAGLVQPGQLRQRNGRATRSRHHLRKPRVLKDGGDIGSRQFRHEGRQDDRGARRPQNVEVVFVAVLLRPTHHRLAERRKPRRWLTGRRSIEAIHAQRCPPAIESAMIRKAQTRLPHLPGPKLIILRHQRSLLERLVRLHLRYRSEDVRKGAGACDDDHVHRQGSALLAENLNQEFVDHPILASPRRVEPEVERVEDHHHPPRLVRMRSHRQQVT